jgi:hypothetical protein
MNIKLNHVFMQNGTKFYLLDLVNHSWSMGLNFGDTVLNQPNLIKAKERTLSSPNIHQNFLIRSNLPWETADPREG